MKRREFSRKVRAEIILRATNERGQAVCEGCGIILGLKRSDVDHTVPEELITDKTKPLTADDGKLLGWDCCHKPKTANDVRTIRKSDRVRDRHTGASRKPSRMAGSRDSNLKKRMDGTVVYRDTGLPVERGHNG